MLLLFWTNRCAATGAYASMRATDRGQPGSRLRASSTSSWILIAFCIALSLSIAKFEAVCLLSNTRRPYSLPDGMLRCHSARL